MIEPSSIGGENLLRAFRNSPIALAEAFLRGDLDGHDEKYAVECITSVVLEAARIRLEKQGWTPVPKPARKA